MHVFIDESGSFSGYHERSVSVVGALVLPTWKLPIIRSKYAKLRRFLPTDKGEVKGRLMNESQVDKVVTLLRRNDAIFELTAVDLGFQTEDEILNYKRQHAREMTQRASRFKEPDRTEVEKACRQIEQTSAPLYLQAIATFEVLKDILDHVPLYFSQRQPYELGHFAWRIDGKDAKKATDWETWWSWYAIGALATMSRTRPQPVLEGADLSHFDRFKMTSGAEQGSDGRLLLSDLQFCSSIEPELELVDIMVNASRRALVGTLGVAGFANISQLMIHRRGPCLKFLLLKDNASAVIKNPAYAGIVKRYFSGGGRTMLSPRFLRQAQDEEIGKQA